MSGRELTDEEIALVHETGRRTEVVQLRIETFFFFAQRLLDEVVLALDVCFGSGRTTLGRHRSLAQNLEPWLKERDLEAPLTFRNSIAEVTRRVKDFRDDHVAHPQSARKSRGLRWSDDSPDLRLSIGVLYPKSPDDVGAEAESVVELLALLDTYVNEVADLLASRR